LRTWFAAMWFVTSQKDGASALVFKQAHYELQSLNVINCERFSNKYYLAITYT